MTDIHACPIPPHGPNPMVQCVPTVLIGFQQATKVGSKSACGGPISMGSPTVFVGGAMAGRLGDPTGHGGVIVTGFPQVLIGNAPKGGG